MEASAPEERSAFPASFVLPLSDEVSSIEGWLELGNDRVAFRNGSGLELRMRLDSVARVSLPTADAGAAPEETSLGAYREMLDDDSHDNEDGNPDDFTEPLEIMRLAGDCGPAQVSWDLLISPGDAKTLGQELSSALGDRDVITEIDSTPDVIELEDDGWLADELTGRGRSPERTGDQGPLPSFHRANDEERVADREMVIRRRRIVAAIIATVALVVAIELLVTLVLLP